MGSGDTMARPASAKFESISRQIEHKDRGSGVVGLLQVACEGNDERERETRRCEGEASIHSKVLFEAPDMLNSMNCEMSSETAR